MDVIEVMMKPETYDEAVSRIRLIQTHISWVFLTGKYAYKVKKPVNFGFLDFTSLEKRKYFCEQEVILNRRLSPEMYIGVLPIGPSNGQFRIGCKGQAQEYAVKMHEFPHDALLSTLLEQRKVSNDTMDLISKVLSDFHSRAETGSHVNQGGSVDTIRLNWSENFEQTREFIGRTITGATFDFVKHKVESFMSKNPSLFLRRIANERIRDCHGDLHSGSIFVLDKIYIFDCIEFNTRFRYSDVAADIAFLIMDLDYNGRHDLSNHFLNRYLLRSSDDEVRSLLPFYECYRAYVRGKVISFRLNDKRTTEEEKTKTETNARAYFELSSTYAEQI